MLPLAVPVPVHAQWTQSSQNSLPNLSGYSFFFPLGSDFWSREGKKRLLLIGVFRFHFLHLSLSLSAFLGRGKSIPSSVAINIFRGNSGFLLKEGDDHLSRRVSLSLSPSFHFSLVFLTSSARIPGPFLFLSSLKELGRF